ncbi:alpha-galactosidase [Kineococcus sp. NBC_00420]|uniref:glycoside hydrolase family 36 protein n=1 Tax=Kineococcus sp. NBC_00420 TaxID=2903564 RepID=UPI002E1B5BC1
MPFDTTLVTIPHASPAERDPSRPHLSMHTDDSGLTWSPGELAIVLRWGVDEPVRVAGLGGGGTAEVTSALQPLVEIMVTGDGRIRNTTRHTHTGVGARLRYLEHETSNLQDEAVLAITQFDPRTGLRVTSTFRCSPDVAAARVTTTVENTKSASVVLEAVTSFATGTLTAPDEDPRDLLLHRGTGEQLAENRWSAEPLWSQMGLADFNSGIQNQPGRSSARAVGTSTWTTVRHLPTGMVENRVTGRALAWQIEHNGGWRWDVVDRRVGEDSTALILLGPEDLDHHWSQELLAGETFVSVPASFAVSERGATAALAQLTAHRRWLRRGHTADAGSLLVYNDFMNTIRGDPTTAALLPLVEAAAAAGAECFCIDAGWYDDTDDGGWWGTVGAWEPSSRRFPGGGMGVVTRRIRDLGMTVGLWLEPEVIGQDSPLARTLPEEAFLRRHGRRVREDRRFFLDLRHPAAQQHLDDTIDRLVADFEVGFFKLDYNVTPGPGTDHEATSVGAGLLGHNRAHLAWFSRLRRRHPAVVFENCSSGAMRADFGMLELFDLQSTSDQQDFRLYPAIAAGAPLQMPPEMAGNWAYAQPTMSLEEIAYCMTTGLSGRLYLSGFINQMDGPQFALVRDAVQVAKDLRDGIARSVPGWPSGYPQWYGDSVTLTLNTPDRALLFCWFRGDDEGQEIQLDLGAGTTAGDLVEVYPRVLQPWGRDDVEGRIVLRPGMAGPSARVYQFTPA